MTISVSNTSNTNTFDFWKNRTNDIAYALSNFVVTTDSNTTVGNATISGTFTANVIVSDTLTVNSIVSNGVLYSGNSTVNGSINSTSIYFGNSTSNTFANTTYIKFGNSTSNVVINTSSFYMGNTTYNVNLYPNYWTISNSSTSFTFNMPTTSQVSNGSYFLNADGTWQPAGSINESSIKYDVTTTGTSQQEIDSFTKASYLAHEYTIIVQDSFANNRVLSKILMAHDGSNAFHTEYGLMTTNNYIGSFSTGSNASHAILYFTPTTPGTTVSFIKVKI